MSNVPKPLATYSNYRTVCQTCVQLFITWSGEGGRADG